jgi:NADPH:quinone reductase
MQALYIEAHGPVANLKARDIPTPTPGPGQILVQIQAAGINPSDIVSAEGRFRSARLPRTLGRDFAGRVVEGPPALIGHDVYGSGGDLGVSHDGTQAEYLVLPRDAVAIRPSNLTAEQAAAVGVPFVTAWTAVIGVGQFHSGQWMIASGAAGAVGSAAAQLAIAHGGDVVALVKDDAEAAHLVRAAAVATSARGDLVEVVHRVTNNRGVDLALNGVGAPLFQPLLEALAPGGAQVTYSAAGGRQVTLDLLEFYHHRHRLLSVDTIAANAVECARILTELTPLFESGALRPQPIAERYPLSKAADAYARVAGGTQGKVVLIPDAVMH